MSDHPTSLYRFFDAKGRLLYVGITSIGPGRWVSHEKIQPWWPLVVRSEVTHYPDRGTAAAAERVAIVMEKPLHNTIFAEPRGPKQRDRTRGRNHTGNLTPREDGWWQLSASTPKRRFTTQYHDEAEARLILAALVGRRVRPAVRDRAIAILMAGEAWDPDSRPGAERSAASEVPKFGSQTLEGSIPSSE